MHMHDSIICIKILQAYVGQTQISHVKILAFEPKGAKWLRKGGRFCNGYNELAFLCIRTDRHEFREKVNRCPLLNLNRRILKIFP